MADTKEQPLIPCIYYVSGDDGSIVQEDESGRCVSLDESEVSEKLNALESELTLLRAQLAAQKWGERERWSSLRADAENRLKPISRQGVGVLAIIDRHAPPAEESDDAE